MVNSWKLHTTFFKRVCWHVKFISLLLTPAKHFCLEITKPPSEKTFQKNDPRLCIWACIKSSLTPWKKIRKESTNTFDILFPENFTEQLQLKLRKHVDKQLLESKKKNKFPFFLFHNMCSYMFFWSCRISLRTQAEKRLFEKFSLYFIPRSESVDKRSSEIFWQNQWYFCGPNSEES